jgi:hypothetical protein
MLRGLLTVIGSLSVLWFCFSALYIAIVLAEEWVPQHFSEYWWIGLDLVLGAAFLARWTSVQAMQCWISLPRNKQT